MKNYGWGILICHLKMARLCSGTHCLRGAGPASVEQLEDLVDVSVSESDRYYPAFQFVIWGGKTATEALNAALIDVAGEA